MPTKKWFKNYPQTYEKVFSGDKFLGRKIFNIDKISNVGGLEQNEYNELFKKVIKQLQDNIFRDFLLLGWFKNNFCYRGKSNSGDNIDIHVREVFKYFFIKIIGFHTNFLSHNSYFIDMIVGYAEEFYPNFFATNPFEIDIKFPFEYMNIYCLGLVSQMDERINLLEYGEEKKMSYAEFIDYILNYCCCYNDEHGDKYIIKDFTSDIYGGFLYIINKKKK